MRSNPIKSSLVPFITSGETYIIFLTSLTPHANDNDEFLASSSLSDAQ